MNNFAAKLAQAVGLTPPQNSAAPAPPAARRAAPAAAEPVPIRAVSTVAATRPSPLPREALAGVPFPTPAQQRGFDALLRKRGWAPPEDIAAKLAQLDKPWLRLQQAITETARGSGARYHQHLESLARRTAQGDTTVLEQDAWSRSDWEDDARERVGAFKAECRALESQAWELAKPVLEAKADAADAASDDLENEVKARFAQFGVPYSPPPYVLLLRKYALSLRDDSSHISGLPSSLLETL